MLLKNNVDWLKQLRSKQDLVLNHSDSVVSLFVCFPSQTRTNVWKCPAFAPTTLNVLIPEGVIFVAVFRDGLETEKFAKVRWVYNLSFI